MIPMLASATPLLALDAVVLDTETTGIDPREARIVQIAAVGLQQGRRADTDTFETLVDPGEPIPPRSTEIHGLTDDAVAGAPAFGEVAPRLDTYIGGRLLIGHNIGYDLAVLKGEHARAGLTWRAPRSLCVRVLAQLAMPGLHEFTIEALAERLDVPVERRHSAMGDARTTAAIFAALVPYLRTRNIRTLGEAEAALAQFTQVLEEHHRAGWAMPVNREAAELSERALARIDAYPYRHRIADVMSRPPIVVDPGTSLRDALKTLIERRVSSLFLAGMKTPAASDCGILTERDILRAVAAEGEATFSRPASDFMSSPLECVFEDAFLYRAIGRMARLNVRHLGVKDEAGRVVGALSQRDLLRLRAGEAISLGDEIDSAQSESALGAAWARLPAVARGLVAEGVGGRDVAAVISREMCALTRRAAAIAEERMHEAGRGGPPVAYALMVLGSGGRGESLLAADQDNAIVHADVADADAEVVDAWFAELGRHMADILDAAGVPYCKGGVMAAKADWRGSVSEWKARVGQWVRRSRPQDLLNVDIFYDLKAVRGDPAMAREIRLYAYERGRASNDFAKLLAEAAAGFNPPLGFFGGFRTENGRVDLKKGGLFPIVAGARVLAIRHGVLEHSTRLRLEGVRALGLGGEEDIERMAATHDVLLDLVLDQQLHDIAQGLSPSNRIDVSRLSRLRSEELRQVLSQLTTLEYLVRDQLFAG